MNHLQKLILPFVLYWHYALDTVLTHVFAISFLVAGFPVLAALLISADSLFKLSLSLPISRLVLLVPLTYRGKLSLIFKLLLIILWFISVNRLSINITSISIFVSFVLFKILLLLDSFVSAEFVFGLKEYFKIDLSKSAAAQNILIRASVFVAPTIALIILKYKYANLLIFMLAIIIYTLCIPCLKNIFANALTHKTTVKEKSLGILVLMTNPYMRWGLAYQILANLAFAGISFLFLKELNPNGNAFFNEITILYFAFLLVQSIVLVFGEDIVPINRLSHISITMGICALAVICAALFPFGMARLIACFFVGLAYSCVLSGVQKVVTTKLRGDGYIEYVGWAQTAGRAISFSSTIFLGFCLSMGFSPSVLLAICGVIGVFSSYLLFILNRATDKKNPLAY